MRLLFPPPFPHQRELIISPARFCWVRGGRRVGKSTAAVIRQMAYGWEHGRTVNWLVDRTLRWARIWFRYYWRRFPRESLAEVNKAELRIELKNGSVFQFFGAENPDSLPGLGIHSLVGMEAARWDAVVWRECLRPALTDYLGWATLNSTPRGMRNWFAEECQKARELTREGQWESSAREFHWPTRLNPNITAAEIANAEQSLPRAVFEQEYLGEFVSDTGRFFSIHPASWGGAFEPAILGAHYAAGFDLAKRRDFTAWAVLRIDTLPWRLVELGRLPRLEFTEQAKRLAVKFKAYQAPALCDQHQETVVELMRQVGCQVEIEPITASSRPTLLTNLAALLEKGEIRLPAARTPLGPRTAEPSRQPDLEALMGEIEHFEPAVSRSGQVRYEAAEGYHDDIIFALAMAVECARSGRAMVSPESLVGIVPFESDGGWS